VGVVVPGSWGGSVQAYAGLGIYTGYGLDYRMRMDGMEVLFLQHQTANGSVWTMEHETQKKKAVGCHMVNHPHVAQL
jgi:hypothetical protein